MRTIENNEKVEKLCKGFSLLDEKEQEYIFGILQALLFAKKKMDLSTVDTPVDEAKKQG